MKENENEMRNWKGRSTNRKEKSLIDTEDVPFKKKVLEDHCHLYIISVFNHVILLVCGTLVMSFECLLVMEIFDVLQM